MSQITNNPWMKTIVETVKSIAQEDTTAEEDEITEIIPSRVSKDRRGKSGLPYVSFVSASKTSGFWLKSVVTLLPF